MIRRAKEEPASGFRSMGLSPTMLRALAHARYTTPTPIQAAFIPHALDGLDVIGQAKTGTGKTAAFGIPLIEMLEARGRGPAGHHPGPDPRARPADRRRAPEARRTARTSRSAASTAASRSSGSSGPWPGASTSSSARPAACSTTSSGRRSTSGDIFHVVLDEADRMLDIGFRPDIERILRKVPDPHQTLLLSATISADDPQAGPALHVRAGRAEPVAGRALGRVDPAVLHHGRARPQVRPAGPPAQARQAAPVHRLHPHQARGRPAGRAAARPGPGRRRRSTATCPRSVRDRVMQGFRDGDDPGPGRHRRRRPRHRRRRTSATSSTSTSPTTPRTTSTGSAGPAGWARTASPTCSSAPTRASR